MLTFVLIAVATFMPLVALAFWELWPMSASERARADTLPPLRRPAKKGAPLWLQITAVVWTVVGVAILTWGRT